MNSNLIQNYELVNSFGFDCKKLNNICLIEPNVIAFVSGNLIHFLQTTTGKIVNRINMTDQGISFVTKNPNPTFNYLTVAESGVKPSIFIYNYKDMNIISICKDGTEHTFSGVNYNSSGTLMVSQGNKPDYTLTIWDWKTSTVIHRTCSSSIDVLNIIFSDHNDEQLLTGGVQHITFCKMTDTFTGPKLASLPGRFGQADVCNIKGICALPDKKVLSNSAWGSILVWVDGQIKYEVCQKNRKPCHNGDISQILYKNGDVMTIGMDGYVRIWFWKTVQLAEFDPNDPFVEVDPTFEYRIGSDSHKCELLSMIKNPDGNCWYAQDGNGGIWQCYLKDEQCNSEMLFRCHAGGIVSTAASPFSSHIVTLGIDGRIHLYDFNTADLLCHYQFSAGGRDLIWLPKTVDPSEIVLIMAFDDGVIRMACVDIIGKEFHLIQAIKSHNAPVNRLLLNETEMILVSGAEDNTIFVYQIISHMPYIRLLPIGLIKMPSAVTALEWNLQTPFSTFVGCALGEIVEVIVQNKPRSYDDITYQLYNTESREIHLNLEDIRYKTNASEDEHGDNSDKVESKALSKILWLKNTCRNTILVSVGGPHSGYIHEYNFNPDVQHILSILVADTIDVASILMTKNCTALGLANGRLLLASNEITTDFLTNCSSFSFHNASYGTITCLCESFDNQFLFSVGLDGNIFAFKSKSYTSNGATECLPINFVKPLYTNDIVGIEFLSLEEQKKKNYRDERIRFVNDKKSEMLEMLEILKADFAELKNRNDLLPNEQTFTFEELDLDNRITRNLSEVFERKMDLIRRKMAFDVEKSRLLKSKVENFLTNNLECWPIQVLAICNDANVPMFRVPKRTDVFSDIKLELDRRNKNNDAFRKSTSGRTVSKQFDQINGSVSEEKNINRSNSDDFLKNLLQSKNELKFDLQMNRLLKKYCDRKHGEADRMKMWDYVNSMLPNPNILDPVDIQALEIAKATIGNYTLKTDENYIPTEDNIVTVERKLTELIMAKEYIHSMRSDFNERVLEARQNKVELCKYVEGKCKIIQKVHAEILDEKIRVIDPVPEINVDLEFAERIFSPAKAIPKQTNQSTEWTNEDNKMSGVLLDALKKARLTYKENDPSWLNTFLSKRETIKLFEQHQILKDVKRRIEQFDRDIIALKKARLLIEIQAKFLETNYLSVYQELWILKDFEETETIILANIESSMKTREIDQMELLNEKSKLEMISDNMREIEEEIKNIDETMKNECVGNKCEKLLLKIFINDCDNSSSSTSCSMSIDYPVDCDPQLLELLKDLKTQRSTMWKQLGKEQHSMTNCTEVIVRLNASIDVSNANLNANHGKLRAISLEKQCMLNEVETLIVLQLDQMQYFTNENELTEIKNIVLVNHSTITRLYQRVDQLATETVDEQRKHRIQKMHLARLRSDFNYMNGQILVLKEKINNIMLKKFGTVIDLDEMEENILKRFLLNFEGSAETIDKEHKKKSDELKKTIMEKEIEMLRVKQERIDKMNILTALQEEKNMIEEAIRYQNKIHMKSITEMEFDLDKDLSKLKSISHQQQEQLQILKKEIQTLRLKAKPFDPQPISASHQITDIPLYQNSSIDDSPKSNRSSFQMANAAEDASGVRKITAVVQNFFSKITAMHMNSSTLDTYTKRIASYIAQVISSYDPENGDEIVRCVSENLKLFLPKRVLRYIQTSDLIQLFNEVLMMFSENEENEDEGKFTVDELLDNIVMELKAKVSKELPDYTERYICEFFEDVFAVLPMDTINQFDRISQIVSLLQTVPVLNPKLIDITKVSAEIIGYFGTTLGNTLNTKDVKRFIQTLVDYWLQKITK